MTEAYILKGFNRMWAKHKCDVPGCPDTLTFDGGLKPHRNICGAKMSGIRFFEKAGVYVFSGCTCQPQPDSKYCWEHKDGESPAIPADSVSQGTRQKLGGKRTDPNYAEDKFYVVESIMKIEGEDQTKTYEVKWAGFRETTIEDDDHLPKFITKYYTDHPNQLGKTLPNPKIKATKTIGGSEVHLLSWDDGSGGDWLEEDFFKYYNDDGDVINAKEHISCNTRKSRDKMVEKDHSVGIFVGAFPCGTIPLFDQLYGSEGTQQLYGIVSDFF